MLDNIKALARCQVYKFPTAAITNYDKLGDLKPHTIIILAFWQLEVRNGSHWAKIKVSAGLCLSQSLHRENLSLCLFKLLEAACIPQLTVLFLHLQSQLQGLSSHAATSLVLSSNPSSTFKDPCDDTGPTQIIRDQFPKSLNVITPANPFCQVR